MINFRVNVWSKSMLRVTSSKKSCFIEVKFTDFNNRNKFLTAKLLKQDYRYQKLCKAFSKFYRRHFEDRNISCHSEKTYATRYL